MAGESAVQTTPARLTRGRHGLAPEQVAASQRARLQGAMVACVAKHGYSATRIRDLARAAAVSPNVVGELYADKEALYLATHDAIAAAELARVRAASETAGRGDWRGRVLAGTRAFFELVVEQPAAANLALSEAHAVGRRALEHQQRTLAAHERLLRGTLDAAPHGKLIPDTTVKALVAGTRALAQHHLDAGSPQALASLGEPVAAWICCYHAALPAALAEPLRGVRGSRARPAPAREEAARAREGGHRERIMRAVAAIACEEGYAALRMPAIAKRAGVSNQTFYEHFANKHEAFLACYDRAGRRALAAVLTAFQAAPDWPRAVRASLQTLLTHIAREPEFARLGLFEILAAGPEARRRAEERASALTAMLTPGAPLAGELPAPPRLLGALVAGGAWGVITHHILAGRTKRLPELTTQLSYMALAPFTGPREAYRVALGG